MGELASPDGTFRAIAGPDMVTLHTPVPLRGQDLTTIGEFEVTAGATVPFVLTHGYSHLAAARGDRPAVLTGTHGDVLARVGRRAASPTANGRTPSRDRSSR